MKSLTKLGVAAGVALFAFAFSPAQAVAQTHNQRLEKNQFKRHQKQERAVYGNNGALRQHQRGEKAQFKAEERAERSGWYGGQYGGWQNGHPRYGRAQNGYPPYGGWQNSYPPSYRSGQYHNQGYGGWFGNGRYGHRGHR